MEYWRNGKLTKLSLIKVWFLHIWLIPGVPIGFYGIALYLDSRGHRSGYGPLGLVDYLLAHSNDLNPILIIVGIGLWLITVKTLAKPLFTLHNEQLRVHRNGFISDDLDIASIAKIKPYSLGPVGTLIDFKSSAGTNFREFILLAKVDKPILREFVGKFGIEVV